jgi:hypothetical protein
MTRLDEIAARLADATPGPWETVPSWHPGYVAAFDSSRGTQVVAEAHRSGLRLAANADLIAHAPEDLAALLAVAHAAQDALSPFHTVRHSDSCDFLTACDCGVHALRKALDDLETP